MKQILSLMLVLALALGIGAWAQGKSGKDTTTQAQGKSEAAKSGATSSSQTAAKPATAQAGNKSKMAGAVDGWITDDMCGAKGANAGAEACTKKCIKEGAKAVFVNDADGKVWMISNPNAIRGHEGHHVRITGPMDAANKTVHVESLRMVGSAGDTTTPADPKSKEEKEKKKGKS